jgi:hypothetical protein
MAFGFAAYVSRIGFPPTRKAGFQVLVRLSWAGFYPQGSDKRFQLTSCELSSSSKLLGTIRLTLCTLPSKVHNVSLTPLQDPAPALPLRRERPRQSKQRQGPFVLVSAANWARRPDRFCRRPLLSRKRNPAVLGLLLED